MNGSEVACRNPAAMVRRMPSWERYSSAGSARTTNSAARNSGTCSNVEDDANSALASNITPLVTKNTGIKNP